MQNNLEELANTIKTIESPPYDDREIKQNINKLLTFMDKIMKYINVIVVYDTERNLSTFKFNDDVIALNILTVEELNKIKTINKFLEINENFIKLDDIFVPIDKTLGLDSGTLRICLVLYEHLVVQY